MVDSIMLIQEEESSGLRLTKYPAKCYACKFLDYWDWNGTYWSKSHFLILPKCSTLQIQQMLWKDWMNE